MESVRFERYGLKFNSKTGLWGSNPMLDNIRYVCEKMMKVDYDGSETQRLCNNYVRQYERSKISDPDYEYKKIKFS